MLRRGLTGIRYINLRTNFLHDLGATRLRQTMFREYADSPKNDFSHAESTNLANISNASKATENTVPDTVLANTSNASQAAETADPNTLDLLSTIDLKIMIASAALYISYQGYRTTQIQNINTLVASLSQSTAEIENFIQETLFSFTDAYSFIEKTDRISASKARELSEQVKKLDKKLVAHLKDFDELKSRGYILPVRFSISSKIESQRKRIMQERLKLDSYHNIFEAMFFTEINKYKLALESMFTALDRYTKATQLDSDKLDYNYENLCNLLLRMPEMISSKKEHLQWVIEMKAELKTFIEFLGKQYIPKHKSWLSDILNYFGYIIFDNLGIRYETKQGLKSEDVNKKNHWCMLPIVIFLELSVKIDSASTIANNNLGYTYAHLGDLEKAKTFIEKSIKTDGSYALNRYNLAHIFSAQGNFDESLNQLEIAAKLLNQNYNTAENKKNMEKTATEYNKLSVADQDLCELIINSNRSIAENKKNMEKTAAEYNKLSVANQDFYALITKSIDINQDDQDSHIFSNEKLVHEKDEIMCRRMIKEFVRHVNINKMGIYERYEYRFFSKYINNFREQDLGKDLDSETTLTL